MTKKGSRVYAIRDADQDTVYMYGCGVYAGDEFPEGISILGMELSDEESTELKNSGFTNPKLVLDDGSVVWGCECWWGPEEDKELVLEGRAVQIVPIERN